MSRRAAKFLTVGVILVIGLIGGWFIGRSPSEGPGINSVSSSFTLVVPAFAQGIPADRFPVNEAGISAYVNASQGIDLGKARTLFKGVEADTGNYIVGTVELPGHTEEMWPHVWIDKSGWILAYYPKTEPTSRIMQWYGYQKGRDRHDHTQGYPDTDLSKSWLLVYPTSMPTCITTISSTQRRPRYS